MNEQRKKQLDNILNQYDEKQTEIQKIKNREQTEEEKFLDEFKRIRRETIRPVFESIAEQLKERGHGCDIEERDDETDAKGRKLSPAIMMKIYPSSVKRSEYREDSTPRIGFFPQVSSRQIYTHVSTMQPNRGGSAGARDYISINDVDADIVEQHVLKAIGDIFSNKFAH